MANDRNASAQRALSRRHFMKMSVIAGGGLLVACQLHDSSSGQGSRTGDAASGQQSGATQADTHGEEIPLGDFIRIDADNHVTVLVGATEIGQGILTGLAMVVAEELDADWSKVRAQHSPVDRVYGIAGAVQATAGSISVRQYYQSQREVGALIRQLLINTAAERWGVDADSLSTDAGYVLDNNGARSASYGELAGDAAQQPMPASAPLKDPSQFRLIGTDRKRVDVAAKVNGSQVYGMDFSIPDMLTVVVARPPRFKGQALRYDDSATMAVPGVLEVHQIPIGIAVVAENFWAAEQGRKALKVDWAPWLGGRTDSSAQRQRYEALLELPGVPIRNEGAPTIAKLTAAQTLNADYYFPFQAHAALEPLNAVVDYDGRSARIWTGTQFPTTDKRIAALTLGLLPDQVEFHTLHSGGGFGRRASFTADFVRDACTVALRVRKPIKLVWSRADDMKGGYYRPMATARLSAAMDRAGDITAWTHRTVAQDVSALFFAEDLADPVLALSEGTLTPLREAIKVNKHFAYAVDNVRMDQHLDVNPAMPALWMRAINKVTDIYAQENFFDVVASHMQRDPYQLRRELLAGKPRHLAVLDAAAQAAGWGQAPADIPGAGTRAMGMAILGHWGSHIAQVVDLSVDADKRITLHRVISAVDCGTVINPDLVRAQIESAVIFALTSLFYGEITLVDGVVQQSNYDDYRLLRQFEAPEIETVIVDSQEKPGGVGELGVPCVGAAVANAVFAATGAQLRELPLKNLGYRIAEARPEAAA